jgi:hypothetical protein
MFTFFRSVFFSVGALVISVSGFTVSFFSSTETGMISAFSSAEA